MRTNIKGAGRLIADLQSKTEALNKKVDDIKIVAGVGATVKRQGESFFVSTAKAVDAVSASTYKTCTEEEFEEFEDNMTAGAELEDYEDTCPWFVFPLVMRYALGEEGDDEFQWDEEIDQPEEETETLQDGTEITTTVSGGNNREFFAKVTSDIAFDTCGALVLACNVETERMDVTCEQDQ